MGVRVGRLVTKHGPELNDGLIKIALEGQGDSKLLQRRQMIGLVSQLRLVMLDGFIRSAQIEQRFADFVMKLGEIRF